MGNNRLGFGPFYNQVMRSQPLAGVALTVFLIRSLACISDTHMSQVLVTMTSVTPSLPPML